MGKSKLDRELEAGAMSAMAPRESLELDAAISKTVIGKAVAQIEPTTMLELAQIQTSPFQSRGEPDEAHIAELMESIEQEGVLVPLLVRPVNQGKRESEYSIFTPAASRYELVTGHNRLEALRRLERTHAPVIIRHLSDAEAARALTADNALHKALSDWELFKHIKMLRETEAAKGQRELSKVLACSQSKIANLEHFKFIPQVLHPILDRQPGLIGYNLMRDIKEYAKEHPKTVIDAINKLAAGKLTQTGVLTWIKRQVEKPMPAFRKEVALDGSRAVYTETEARIVSNVLDFEKLHALIEANYDALKKS